MRNVFDFIAKWNQSRFYNRNVYLFPLLLLNFLFLSCNSHSSRKQQYEPTYSVDSSGKKVLIFGVPNLSSYEDCDLLVKYLNKNLSNIFIRIVASTDVKDYENKIKKNEFDFIIINGPLLLEAEKNGYSIVAKMGDDEKYKSVIFVRNDSAINKISDLKGKTIATSGPPALAGTMMPLFYLYKNGLDVNKDIKHLYSPSFESTIMNVYLGKCAAGASKKASVVNIFKQRPEIASKLSIKWETPPLINNAFMIKNNMDKEMADALTKLILTLQENEEGKKALIPLDVSRFEKANMDTYKPLKVFLKEYNTSIH